MVAMWGLGADLRSSARAASTLNWGAASPASHKVLKMAQLSDLATACQPSHYQKSIMCSVLAIMVDIQTHSGHEYAILRKL